MSQTTQSQLMIEDMLLALENAALESLRDPQESDTPMFRKMVISLVEVVSEGLKRPIDDLVDSVANRLVKLQSGLERISKSNNRGDTDRYRLIDIEKDRARINFELLNELAVIFDQDITVGAIVAFRAIQENSRDLILELFSKDDGYFEFAKTMDKTPIAGFSGRILARKLSDRFDKYKSTTDASAREALERHQNAPNTPSFHDISLLWAFERSAELPVDFWEQFFQECGNIRSEQESSFFEPVWCESIGLGQTVRSASERDESFRNAFVESFGPTPEAVKVLNLDSPIVIGAR